MVACNSMNPIIYLVYFTRILLKFTVCMQHIAWGMVGFQTHDRRQALVGEGGRIAQSLSVGAAATGILNAL